MLVAREIPAACKARLIVPSSRLLFVRSIQSARNNYTPSPPGGSETALRFSQGCKSSHLKLKLPAGSLDARPVSPPGPRLSAAVLAGSRRLTPGPEPLPGSEQRTPRLGAPDSSSADGSIRPVERIRERCPRAGAGVEQPRDLVLVRPQSHFLEGTEHLPCARRAEFSKLLWNQWCPLSGVSQPTWERESSHSYWTEENPEAGKGEAGLSEPRPDSGSGVWSPRVQQVTGKQSGLPSKEAFRSSVLLCDLEPVPPVSWAWTSSLLLEFPIHRTLLVGPGCQVTLGSHRSRLSPRSSFPQWLLGRVSSGAWRSSAHATPPRPTLTDQTHLGLVVLMPTCLPPCTPSLRSH